LSRRRPPHPAHPSNLSVRPLHGSRGCVRAFLFGTLFSAAVAIAPASAQAPPRIRYIRIETENVFQDAESSFLARAADAIHGVTRAEVVRRELLFAEGNALDPPRLAETERNLRALGLSRPGGRQGALRGLARGKEHLRTGQEGVARRGRTAGTVDARGLLLRPA